MITSSTLIGLLVSMFTSFWSFRFLFKLDMYRLEQLEEYFAKYNHAALTVLARQTIIPASVLHALEYWNTAVSDKRFAMRVALMLMQNAMESRRGLSDRIADEVRDNFFRQHPDIEADYVTMAL